MKLVEMFDRFLKAPGALPARYVTPFDRAHWPDEVARIATWLHMLGFQPVGYDLDYPGSVGNVTRGRVLGLQLVVADAVDLVRETTRCSEVIEAYTYSNQYPCDGVNVSVVGAYNPVWGLATIDVLGLDDAALPNGLGVVDGV